MLDAISPWFGALILNYNAGSQLHIMVNKCERGGLVYYKILIFKNLFMLLQLSQVPAQVGPSIVLFIQLAESLGPFNIILIFILHVVSRLEFQYIM